MTDEERLARKRDWFHTMFYARRAREAIAAIDLDALNEYYGFHGGPCLATCSSATPTSPPTT